MHDSNSLCFHIYIYDPRVHTENATIFQGLFKDHITFSMQGPPARNIINTFQRLYKNAHSQSILIRL